MERGGEGDWIDLAVYECQAGFRDRRTIALTAAAYTGLGGSRQPPVMGLATGIRPCADGFVNLAANGALTTVVGRQYSIQPMISAFRSQRRASRIRRMRFSCPTGRRSGG